MPYMAVGSRQILYSSSQAPALPRDDIAEVASLEDNSGSENTERISASEERAQESPDAPPGPGANLDLLA